MQHVNIRFLRIACTIAPPLTLSTHATVLCAHLNLQMHCFIRSSGHPKYISYIGYAHLNIRFLRIASLLPPTHIINIPLQLHAHTSIYKGIVSSVAVHIQNISTTFVTHICILLIDASCALLLFCFHSHYQYALLFRSRTSIYTVIFHPQQLTSNLHSLKTRPVHFSYIASHLYYQYTLLYTLHCVISSKPASQPKVPRHIYCAHLHP